MNKKQKKYLIYGFILISLVLGYYYYQDSHQIQSPKPSSPACVAGSGKWIGYATSFNCDSAYQGYGGTLIVKIPPNYNTCCIPVSNPKSLK